MTLKALMARLRALVMRRTSELELDDEIAFHIERETEKLTRAGVGNDDAHRLALARFGGVTQAREAHRTVRGLPTLEHLAGDIRYVARTMRRTPVFAVTAVVTIALGIAATTLVVGAVRALLLRPLPVREPERLVRLSEDRDGAGTTFGETAFSYQRWRAYRDATAAVFTGLAGDRYDTFAFRRDGPARVLSGVTATSNYFDVVGVRPELGRFFTSADGDELPDLVVVIGYDFWQREFGSDPSIVGKTLYIDSRLLTIVAVAPNHFGGTIVGLAPDVWVPAAISGEPVLTLFGRLRPGLSTAGASAALAGIAPSIPMVRADEKPARRASVYPLTGLPRIAQSGMAAFMALLLATAGLVLLIAATNVAGMLLARAAARHREIAIRLAIGASRGRLVRQLVTESLTIFSLGGTLGILVAAWLGALVSSYQPPLPMRVAIDLGVDWFVLAIAVATTLGAGILAGLAPALQSTRPELLSSLKDDAAARHPRRARLRSAFVVAQLAMSVILLITSGLFVRALQRALAVDVGFQPDGVVIAELSVGAHGYSMARGRAFFDQVIERLSARPEIESASYGMFTPLSRNTNNQWITSPERRATGAKPLMVQYGWAGVGFIETLRVPMLEGRTFRHDDPPGAALVVINHTLASRLWPGASAVGQSLLMRDVPMRVIGVMKNGKYQGLSEQPRSFLYTYLSSNYSSSLLLHARVRGDPTAALDVIEREVAAIDPNIALERAGPLSAEVATYVAPQRLAAWLVGGFGITGLLLAALGIYGVVSYYVAQRTREFGIRMALGARSGDVTSMVQRKSLTLVAMGTGAGMLAAAAVTRLAANFLYGVGATDPPTFLAVSIILGLVALLASFIPARRAARVNPMVSLRAE